MYLVLEGFSAELAGVIEIARQAADWLPARSIKLIQALIRESVATSVLSPACGDEAILKSERAQQSQETYAALDTFVAETLRGFRIPFSDNLRTMAVDLERTWNERQSDLSRQLTSLQREGCWICGRHGEGEGECWRIGETDAPEEMRLRSVHAGACSTSLEEKVRRGDVRGSYLGSMGNLFKAGKGNSG